MLSHYDEMKTRKIASIKTCPDSFKANGWAGPGPDRIFMWDAKSQALYCNHMCRFWVRADIKSLTLGEVDNLIFASTKHTELNHRVDAIALEQARREADVSDKYGSTVLYELTRLMHLMNMRIPREGYDHKEIAHTQPMVARLLDPELGGINKDHQALLALDVLNGLDIIQKTRVAELPEMGM